MHGRENGSGGVRHAESSPSGFLLLGRGVDPASLSRILPKDVTITWFNDLADLRSLVTPTGSSATVNGAEHDDDSKPTLLHPKAKELPVPGPAPSRVQPTVTEVTESSPQAFRVVRAIHSEIIPRVPLVLRGFLWHAAHHPIESITPKVWDKHLGFPFVELNRALERGGMPSAADVQRWIRLLHAAALLDDPQHTVQSVATTLRWYVRPLYRISRELIDATPIELRERGGFAYVWPLFKAALRGVPVQNRVGPYL
jgi:hypothetical protein